MYYQNNIISTINLLECCAKFKIKGFIFSSSATVYSPNQEMPLKETDFVGINLTNPYARTKYFIEEMIKDFCHSNPNFKCVILRYFNPIGSHESGLLDENPKGIPQNLMPNIIKYMNGSKDILHIYGNDYQTKDGTCIRDFIHVRDLAFSHVVALQRMMFDKLPKQCNIYNVGTGKGTSVLEIINILEKYTNKKIKYEFKNKRPGDIPIVYCDISKITKELNWTPKYTVSDALKNYK